MAFLVCLWTSLQALGAPMGASLRTGLPLLGICPASWTNCPRKIAQVQVDRIFAKQPENAVRGATQLQELPSELSFDLTPQPFFLLVAKSSPLGFRIS